MVCLLYNASSCPLSHAVLSLPQQVVKQTVMTSVYGVTFVGARAQIQNVLGDKMIGHTDESGVRERDSKSQNVRNDAVCCLHL